MKLDEGACVFGAGVLLKHREDLEKEIEKVRAGSGEADHDTDPVHDARVASRRLRATLPLFTDCLPSKKSKKWLKSIRKVTRALGEARDTDVQVEWVKKVSLKLPEVRLRAGVNRLVLRLRQKRQRLQEPLDKALGKFSASGMLEDVAAELEPAAARASEVYIYTPTLYQHSFRNIHERLETLLSYDEIVYQPDKITELHQMRIAAKWLRYTMETFSPLYAGELKDYLQVIRAIQDLLGDIHDCDVWIEFLPKFMGEEQQRTLEYFGRARPFRRLEPGILYLEQNRREARAELYQKFVGKWQAWQSTSLWDELRRTIQTPAAIQPGEVYPPRREETNPFLLNS